MTPRERHERLMSLFDALCDLPEGDYEARLVAIDGEDARLAAELRSLLAHDRAAPTVLMNAARSVAAVARDLAPPPPLDRRRARSSDALVGQTLERRWRIEAPLGAGGHGQVFRARDLSDERAAPVALKLLHPGSDSLATRRFAREYLAISRLDHPGCVRVLGQGSHRGARFIVMELVDGGDLQTLAGAASDLIYRVLVGVCDALAYVHELGIIHRDLKPANVLLARDPSDGALQPKLADFGIAKIHDEALSTLSAKGLLVGTIDFVSPEQVMGRPVGPASDLYSLGCIMHVLWAGQPPFSGTTFERLSGRVDRDAPSLSALAPTVPPPIASLAARLLARRPEDRPRSAAEVARALTVVLDADE